MHDLRERGVVEIRRSGREKRVQLVSRISLIGEEGPVRLLSPRYSKSLWQGVTQVGDVPVVSKLQLVLDLWNHPVRGREQTGRLLETLEKGRGDGG